MVKHFGCRKFVRLYVGFSGWELRPFLCQDADVMSLADICTVVRCFVRGDKLLMKTGLECCPTIPGSMKIDLCLVLTECLSRRIVRFRTSAIHSERVSNSTSSFFAHRLVYS